MKLDEAAKKYNVSKFEIIGILYWRGVPIKYTYSYAIELTKKQEELLMQYYIFSDIEKIEYEYKQKKFYFNPKGFNDITKRKLCRPYYYIGVLDFYDEKYHYGKIITNDFIYGSGIRVSSFSESKEFYFDTTLMTEDLPESFEGLLLFRPATLNGCNFTDSIKQFNVKFNEDKDIAIQYVINNNYIRIGKNSKQRVINIFKESKIDFYETLLNYLTLLSNNLTYKDDSLLFNKNRSFIEAVGGQDNFLQMYKNEISSNSEKSNRIMLLTHKLFNIESFTVLLLHFKTIVDIIPRDDLYKIILYYEEINVKNKLDNYSTKTAQGRGRRDLIAIEFLEFKKQLKRDPPQDLYKKFSKSYFENLYWRKLWKENDLNWNRAYDEYKDNFSDRAIWDAMTDGEDYPDNGFDGDYESNGF